jgi:hypothetical protein
MASDQVKPTFASWLCLRPLLNMRCLASFQVHYNGVYLAVALNRTNLSKEGNVTVLKRLPKFRLLVNSAALVVLSKNYIHLYHLSEPVLKSITCSILSDSKFSAAFLDYCPGSLFSKGFRWWCTISMSLMHSPNDGTWASVLVGQRLAERHMAIHGIISHIRPFKCTTFLAIWSQRQSRTDSSDAFLSDLVVLHAKDPKRHEKTSELIKAFK